MDQLSARDSQGERVTEYEAPRLSKLGTVESWTQSGSGPMGDSMTEGPSQ